jgi:asparagine synthase (glutamine-hydrolysing)
LPNICGIVDTAADPAGIKAINDRQLTVLSIAVPGLLPHRYFSPACAISLLDTGILDSGPLPVRSFDGRTVLFIDGEIYNGDEIRQQYLADLGAEELSDASLILALYERLGNEAFGKLNGLFCIAIFDERDRRLTLVSDRYGFRPLFYLKSGNRFVFASELKAVSLVTSTRRIDELGLFELFAYGQHVIYRTWLEGCRKLSPGTILTIDEGGVRADRYWVYQYNEDAARLDQASYISIYRTLLDRAVERSFKGDKSIGLFLSGGYDSRVIAASIRPHHGRVPAYTFGDEDSRDVVYASQLAASLGLRHRVVSSSARSLSSMCEPIVWRTEGMLPFIEQTSIQFHKQLRTDMDVILVGLLGEFSGSHTWPQLLLSRNRPRTIKAIFERFVGSREGILRAVFSRDFSKRISSELRRQFDESFHDVVNQSPMNIADSWNFQVLQHRGSFFSPAADRHRLEVRAPHLDAELVDFLLTIPPRERIEQRVYKKMIVYGFPQIRNVPCTNSGKPVNPSFVTEYSMMILRYLGRRAINLLPATTRSHGDLGRESTDIDTTVRAEPELISNILEPLIEDGIFSTDIFDVDGIRQIVTDHYDRGARHALTISLLISWGIAAKHFLHGEHPETVPDSWFAD